MHALDILAVTGLESGNHPALPEPLSGQIIGHPDGGNIKKTGAPLLRRIFTSVAEVL